VSKYNAEFDRQVRQVKPEAMQALVDCRWPGNVRQLEAVVERAVLMTDGDVLTLRDVGSQLNKRRAEPVASPYELPEDGIDFEQLEKELIQKAMQRAGGVATKAARLLKMNYKAFLYRLEKFGIRAGEAPREE